MALSHLQPLFANNRNDRPPKFVVGEGEKREAPYLEARILIIEDEVMIAWTIESLLLDAGFTDIAIASDAMEASTASIEAVPTLVVSDINLGAAIDGVEASIAICQAANIPVLFVTAYADEATRSRIASHFPTSELLRKPVDGPTLVNAVHRALGLRSRH